MLLYEQPSYRIDHMGGGLSEMIHVVMLSGGSGSRLWPLSNSTRSKQFLKVLRDEKGNPQSMVQRIFEQLRTHSDVGEDIDVTIATCANQENSIREQIQDGYSLVIEPERRDTAPAIMLACAYLAYVKGASPDDAVVIMPIDSFANQDYLDCVIRLGLLAKEYDGIVLLGVEPTYPSEKYGYIIPEAGGCDNGIFRVKEFKEKPDKNAAQRYIAQGAFWNCGVFGFKLGYILGIIAKYNDSRSFYNIRDNYSDLPKISFDYEVVEKEENVGVIAYDGEWKDLGTWNTLTEEMHDPVHGRAVASEIENVHVINETGLPLVVSGVNDAVVVATHDGILVSSKEASANIKKLVEAVSDSRPMYEKRRWGEYRVLDSSQHDGQNVLTKELVVFPGKQLSYQRHSSRLEVWTIVSGEGEVVIDGRITPVMPGAVLTIYPMQMHSVRAVTKMNIIEVQLGAALVEEDIERFGDFWANEDG